MEANVVMLQIYVSPAQKKFYKWKGVDALFLHSLFWLFSDPSWLPVFCLFRERYSITQFCRRFHASFRLVTVIFQ